MYNNIAWLLCGWAYIFSVVLSSAIYTPALNGFQVHKQGVALGRSVDLSKFTDYDELKAELDKMFEFDGELVSANRNWQIVYTDNEGDMMLVGDDPWE